MVSPSPTSSATSSAAAGGGSTAVGTAMLTVNLTRILALTQTSSGGGGGGGGDGGGGGGGGSEGRANLPHTLTPSVMMYACRGRGHADWWVGSWQERGRGVGASIPHADSTSRWFRWPGGASWPRCTMRTAATATISPWGTVHPTAV